MKPRHHGLLDRANTVLLLVDMQEPLLRGIFERDKLVDRCRILAIAARLLKIPVVTTTQNIARLGPIISEVAQELPPDTPDSIDKMTFSCAANQAFTDELLRHGRDQVLIAGIETHICVVQTALDLMHIDYKTNVVVDAVSSRTERDHHIGLARLNTFNVPPCSTEGAIMELLWSAESEEFKSILGLIK